MPKSRRELLKLFKKDRLRCWRLRRKKTGETVEILAQSLSYACYKLGWKEGDVYWVEVGYKNILTEPRNLGHGTPSE